MNVKILHPEMLFTIFFTTQKTKNLQSRSVFLLDPKLSGGFGSGLSPAPSSFHGTLQASLENSVETLCKTLLIPARTVSMP